MTRFTPFLSELGFDSFERGIILSSYAVTSIIFQFLFGYLSDKYRTIKKIVVISMVFYLLGTFFLFDENNIIFILQLLVIAVIGGLNNTYTGLFDIWVMGINKHMSNSLSFIKGFGSIGWAVGSLLSVFIITQLQYSGLKWILLVLSLLLVLLIYFLPDVEKIEQYKSIQLKDVMQLLKNADYVLFVLALLLMYSLIVANTGIVIDKMIALGATDYQISLKWFMGSLLEIPTYLVGASLLKRIRPIRLLQFSSIILICQFVLFALANSSIQMIWISLLQIFTTPIIMVASKLIIYEIAPKHLMNSSQLIALSIFTGIPSLIVPFIAGFLAITIGYNQTLMMVAVIGIASLLVTILFIWASNRRERSKNINGVMLKDTSNL
jgi:MFS transporter, OHS family, lactose permease